MKAWRLALVTAVAVLALVIPTSPAQSSCGNPMLACQQGWCNEYCQCYGYDFGICTSGCYRCFYN